MNTIGLILNFLGAVILAFSTGSFFKWISLCIQVHETAIQGILSKGDILNLVGADKHLMDSYEKSKKWMVLGILLIIVGFGFQVLALLTKG